ncbi:MAG: hypothetical protein PHI35_06325 [Victivallaceae bacterium]|nr:hypothetical protein [Victivallaceae bacterium]
MKKLFALFAATVCITMLAGCTAIKSAAFGIASNGTVVKIETTGSTTSGTVAPNLMIGTVQNSIASAPALPGDAKTQIAVSYTESQSGLAAVFGHTAVTRTFSYVGLPSETAEQSKVRLEAVAAVLKSNAVGSQSTPSGDEKAEK